MRCSVHRLEAAEGPRGELNQHLAGDADTVGDGVRVGMESAAR